MCIHIYLEVGAFVWHWSGALQASVHERWVRDGQRIALWQVAKRLAAESVLWIWRMIGTTFSKEFSRLYCTRSMLLDQKTLGKTHIAVAVSHECFAIRRETMRALNIFLSTCSQHGEQMLGYF